MKINIFTKHYERIVRPCVFHARPNNLSRAFLRKNLRWVIRLSHPLRLIFKACRELKIHNFDQFKDLNRFKLRKRTHSKNCEAKAKRSQVSFVRSEVNFSIGDPNLGLFSITDGLITNCCDYQKARSKHNTLLFRKSDNENMREVLATFFLVIFSFNGDYL